MELNDGINSAAKYCFQYFPSQNFILAKGHGSTKIFALSEILIRGHRVSVESDVLFAACFGADPDEDAIADVEVARLGCDRICSRARRLVCCLYQKTYLIVKRQRE